MFAVFLIFQLIIIIVFPLALKKKGQTGDNGVKNVEVMVALKYLRNFWITIEMPLINCETNLIATWYENCVM